MPSPFLYFAGARLSQAELSSACLDGHLVGIGEGYIPADLVDTMHVRAASLTELLGDTLAATHASAAWVLGRLDEPPPRHSVQRAVDRRLHHVVSRRLIYHDPVIAPEDLIEVGGTRVSTPARTLADLARSKDPASHRLAVAWCHTAPHDVPAAPAWLDAHRSMPQKKAARELLSGALLRKT